MGKLLTAPTGNPKTAKSGKVGERTYILHLAPAKRAGRTNVCQNATPACLAVCLNLAGRGGLMKAGETTNPIQEARIRKTRMFFDDREAFLAQLRKEIKAAIRKGEREGFSPSFRLNGTSDLAWEEIGIPQEFPGNQFYDYTKSAERYAEFLAGNLPPNYHLTFSRSETNEETSEQFVRNGGNATVVFEGEIPSEWRGLPVFNADDTDYRPSDPRGHWLGLRFKGTKAKRERAVSLGFAV